MGFFTFQDNYYPDDEYFIQVRGNNVGVKSIGNQRWVIVPQPYDTYWGKSSVQEVIDDMAAQLFSGGVIEPDIDADAQLVIDAMVNPTQTQISSINAFVISEKAVGNWALMDDFACGSLGDVEDANGLLKWKSLTQMTANGGAAMTLDGWVLDGLGGFIDTIFNPSIDGVKYAINDANVSVFVKGYIQTTNAHVFGTYVNPNGIQWSLGNGTATGSRFNGSDEKSAISYVLSQGALATISREDPSNMKYIESGVVQETVANNSLALPNRNLALGALLTTSNDDVLHLNGKISTWSIGAAIGFDHPAHNTNVRKLLNDLGQQAKL